MKVQIGIFECTGIMGQDLIHPYIKSTTVLCDYKTHMDISTLCSFFFLRLTLTATPITTTIAVSISARSTAAVVAPAITSDGVLEQLLPVQLVPIDTLPECYTLHILITDHIP